MVKCSYFKAKCRKGVCFRSENSFLKNNHVLLYKKRQKVWIQFSNRIKKVIESFFHMFPKSIQLASFRRFRHLYYALQRSSYYTTKTMRDIFITPWVSDLVKSDQVKTQWKIPQEYSKDHYTVEINPKYISLVCIL